MQGEVKERWKLLCEQAVTEQDPVRLLALVKEIDELLSTKENRLLKEQLSASDRPEFVALSPIKLLCPRCHAMPGVVCEVLFGDELEIVHLERIEAALVVDAAAKKTAN